MFILKDSNRGIAMCHLRYVKLFRIILALVAMSIFPLRHSLATDRDKKPLFYTSFSGSYNDPGWMFKLDTTAGYRFNSHLEIIAGLPVYFVQVPGDSLDDSSSSRLGIGNVYVDLRLMAERSGFYFGSRLRGTAPTGNKEEGFSTGRVTFDWNNYFEYSIGEWTPFGTVGIANSISDTHFFTRPFTSLGIVGQLEGGLLFDPAVWIGLGISGYAVVPSGEQKIYSRLPGSRMAQTDSMPSDGSDATRRQRRAFEDTYYTVGDADIAKDHGLSGWIDIYPFSDVALEFGYSRSVSYEYNTIFFTARFDLAGMIRKNGF
ncbi:MAG: hypothetical protein P8Y80_15795 [Acidobacteriota bacterium]